MSNIEDYLGFETFGADVKAARKAKRLTRKTMAEIINVDFRYLANIENDGTIISLPVIIQLIKECGLPVKRQFQYICRLVHQKLRIRHGWNFYIRPVLRHTAAPSFPQRTMPGSKPAPPGSALQGQYVACPPPACEARHFSTLSSSSENCWAFSSTSRSKESSRLGMICTT